VSARGAALAAEDVAQIRSRVRLELGRHSASIASTRLHLTDGSASGSGPIACRIRVTLILGSRVVVEDAGEHWTDAARNAARRLARRLDRDPAIRRRGLGSGGLGKSR